MASPSVNRVQSLPWHGSNSGSTLPETLLKRIKRIYSHPSSSTILYENVCVNPICHSAQYGTGTIGFPLGSVFGMCEWRVNPGMLFMLRFFIYLFILIFYFNFNFNFIYFAMLDRVTHRVVTNVFRNLHAPLHHDVHVDLLGLECMHYALCS